MKNHHKYFRNFFYSVYSSTIRTFPENYWVASVKDGNLIFDSCEGMIVDRIDQQEVLKFWNSQKIHEAFPI